MFKELSIQNFALIEESEVSWNPELNILTGETGAGKSILLAALKLILGDRADLKSIKNPDKKCVVEATFDISKLNIKPYFDKNEVDYEDITILRREILPGGKSRAFVNDCPTNLETLKEISNQLLSIHSQFETSDLLDENFQMELLDEFSNNQKQLESYKSIYFSFTQKNKELKKLEDEFLTLKKESDYNTFLLNELNQYKFDQIDLTDLESQVKSFEHYELIISELYFANKTFENEDYGILQFLRNITQKLEKIAIYSPKINLISERLNPLLIDLEDINSELIHINESFEIDPEKMLQIQNLYNQIQQLIQKHQVKTIEELQKIKDSLIQKNSNFEQIETKIEDLKTDIKLIEQELNLICEKLHQSRQKNIPLLIKTILELISPLGMDKASLEIELLTQNKFNEFGKELIQMNFSANAGMQIKPLDKAISGGERSRMMLVLKNILAKNKQLPTIIFDEIDTGVSGKIANEMGKMILEMARTMQILVITHLPQMASKGNKHYKVFKYEENGQTKSSIKMLSNEERILEIANLLSGENITNSAINQAKELIN